MKATGWGVCALAVLTAGLVGCPGADMFTQKSAQQMNRPEDYLVDSKLEAVVSKTQAILQQLGIKAAASPDDDGVRLVGTTAAGKHVAVVLTRSVANETLTVVHLEWEAEEDGGLPRQIIAGLDRAGVKVLVSGG